MNLRSSIAVTAAMLVAHPTAAQDHRFEADPVASVRENFVACEVLSQLRRVMDDPRFLLTGECEPLSAGRRVRIYARRGPYVCIYPEDTITPCKWTHEKALSKKSPPALTPKQKIANLTCWENHSRRDCPSAVGIDGATGAPILASSWGQPHDAHRRHRPLPPNVHARLVASVLSDMLGQHTSGGRTCG